MEKYLLIPVMLLIVFLTGLNTIHFFYFFSLILEVHFYTEIDMRTFSQWFLFHEINSFLSWWATFFLFYKWPTFFFFSLLPMPHKSFLSFSPSSLPFLLFPSSLPLLLPSPPSPPSFLSGSHIPLVGWNSICRRWPWISDPPTFTSWVLRSQACTTLPSFIYGAVDPGT